MSKIKYQPSLYVAREPGETSVEFIDRIIRDHKLLPDQLVSLKTDNNAAFDDCLKGIWIEQAPLVTP